MRFLLSAKWSAIMLLNLSGALKILPILILIVCFLLELINLNISRSALFVTAGLLLLILPKLLFGHDAAAMATSATAFEGISFAFMVFVLPFYRSESRLIRSKRWPVVIDVLNVTFIVLIVDLVVRIYIHGAGQFFNLAEYSLAKECGLFSTSNISGGLAFVLYCYSLSNRSYSLYLWVNVILLLGSLSRVSIFAAALVTAYHFYTSVNNVYIRKPVQVLIISLIGYLVIPIYDYFLSDGSFNSKIDLVRAGITKFMGLTSPNVLLFGLPPDALMVAEFLDIEGWSPHVSLLKALLYYGIAGFILWVIGHYYIWQKTQLKTVVAGGLLMGLSGLPIVWPPLLLTLFVYKHPKTPI